MTAGVESQLELGWLGGPSERRLREARPGFDDLPWGSFDPAGCDPDELLESRAVWTNGVFTEYASAAAFSALNIAFLECQAPVDLMRDRSGLRRRRARPRHAGVEAGDGARRCHAVPRRSRRGSRRSRGRPTRGCARPSSPVKISCVGEALSLPALGAAHRGATHPLARGVLDRLRHDEGPHAAIGHWFLAWAEPWLTDGEREYLGHVASEAVAIYEPLWLERPERTVIEHGQPISYRAYMETAVRERIVERLAKVGIRVTLAPPAAGEA